MVNYKCGHKTSGMIVMDCNPMSMSAYLEWKDSVGIDGTREQCWKCWCEARNTKRKKMEDKNR